MRIRTTRCMTYHRIVVLVGWILVCLCQPTHGEQVSEHPIKIVAPEWPTYTNQDGSGLYFELFKAIYEPTGIHLEITFVPWARAMKEVQEQDANVMFGVFDVSVSKIDYFVTPRYPIETERTVTLFKRGLLARWEGQTSLENRKVTTIRGYNYQEYLTVPVQLHEVNDAKTALALIERDRMEFYLEESNVLDEAIKNQQLDRSQYQIETILVNYLYPAFATSPRGQQFLEIYNRRMPELIASGAMAQLYQKWNRVVPQLDEQ